MKNKLNNKLRKQIQTLDEGGMGYWIVKARLLNGDWYSNVCITDSFTFGFPHLMPFTLGEITEIAWDRGAKPSGAPIKVVTAEIPTL